MTNEQKILNAFASFKELTKGELKQITKIAELNEALSELLKQGKIKRVKQGVYALDKTNFIDPQQGSLFS